MSQKKPRRFKGLELNQIVSKKDLLKRFSSHKSVKRWDKGSKEWKMHPVTNLLIDYKYAINVKKEVGIATVYGAESKRQRLKWLEIEGTNNKKSHLKGQYISLPMIITKN